MGSVIKLEILEFDNNWLETLPEGLCALAALQVKLLVQFTNNSEIMAKLLRYYCGADDRSATLF